MLLICIYSLPLSEFYLIEMKSNYTIYIKILHSVLTVRIEIFGNHTLFPESRFTFEYFHAADRQQNHHINIECKILIKVTHIFILLLFNSIWIIA